MPTTSAPRQAHSTPRKAAALELKFAPVDLQAAEAEGTISGYAALFNVADLGRDVIAPGAFRQSLAGQGAAGVKMLFQHDPNEPIGVWQEVREDARGLFVRGRLLPDVARAREVLQLIRAGALDGLSIGYRTLKARPDHRQGTRLLQQVELWEVSVVTFPMQPGARVDKVKNRPFANGFPTEREFERWLVRDAGFSRSQARTAIRAGFRALAVSRDAGGADVTPAALAQKMRQAAKLIRNAARRTR